MFAVEYVVMYNNNVYDTLQSEEEAINIANLLEDDDPDADVWVDKCIIEENKN